MWRGFVLLFLFNSVISQDDLSFGVDVEKAPKVQRQLSQGWIEGYELETEFGTANVFKKIPFIEPPVGPLRFHAPVPVRSWDGILDATKPAPACPQNYTKMSPYSLKYVKEQSEDCIYLNVYADKRCNQERLCPVVFYIHGGEDQYGTPREFNDVEIARHFAAREIVWVLPSFRLGILGWMDIGPQIWPDAPYNAGLLDLIQALRWTQREILTFGGNPRDIVLFGHSSGGHLGSALLSSVAVEEKAFSRAILFSPGSVANAHLNRPRSSFILEKVGCYLNDKLEPLNMTSRLDCLRKKPVEELINAGIPLEGMRPQGFSGAQPDGYTYIEPTVAGYMNRWHPLPLLIGVTAVENDFDLGYNDTDVCLNYVTLLCPNRKDECDQKCKDRYAHGRELPISASFVHAFSWILGFVNTNQGAPTWYQVWDEYHANAHADELIFAFGLNAEEGFHRRNVGHQIMKKFFPRLLRKFILEGSVVDGWLPMDAEGRGYYYNNIKAIGKPSNYTIVEKPHFVPNVIFDEPAIDFWWRDLAHVHWHKGDQGEEEEEASGLPHPPSPKEEGVPWWIFVLVIIIMLILAMSLFVVIGVPIIWKTRQSTKH
ncbi:unnamed protein product [Bursaphelenchus xylophilus]|uniref:Carboxylic ester hydrolase n=1 Tax=Bursaphelenchus xylophilus TaxID=6326 RepID=A0A1I7RXF9_BURXY|nr:unnamed protein product [Bursaphelenchus xylophilus]CAG9126378.1 unnamed protein product [Bursaphelenchus xylophilus]